MHVEIRTRGKKKKYYLAHSIRKGSKVKKISVYLGLDLSKTELVQKRKQAEAIILERIKSQKIIRNPFRATLSQEELEEIKSLESKGKIRIAHLSDEDWAKFAQLFTYDTNAIEGSTVTAKEVKEILESDKLPKKPKYEIAHISLALKISDEAARVFIEEGYACSEATLLAFAKRNGLDTACVKAATGFGAGLGRKGSLCGALTGGVIALGLKHGRTSAKDNSSKEKTLELSGKYYDAFEKEFGSIMCKELCGCDLSTEEGRKKFKDKNVRAKVCANIVGHASEILANIEDEA